MESRQSKERDKILALKKEQADIAQKNDLLRLEQRDLSSSVEDLRKRSKFGPVEYMQVELEHTKRMEKIKGEIADFIMKKDEIQSNYSALHISYANKQKELKITKKLLEECNKELKSTNSELESTSNKLKTYKIELGNVILSNREKLQLVSVELKEKIKELQQVTEETLSKKKEIERESHVLAIRRSDLEIYEGRLRRKYPNRK